MSGYFFFMRTFEGLQIDRSCAVGDRRSALGWPRLIMVYWRRVIYCIIISTISVNAALFRVGLRTPVWGLSSVSESLMSKRSSSVQSGTHETASGTRFSVPVCPFALAHHCITISYSLKSGAHLWGLGLRSRLRNSRVSSEQSVTRRKRLPARNYRMSPIMLPVNHHAFTSRGPSTGSNFKTRWLRWSDNALHVCLEVSFLVVNFLLV